MTLDERIQAYFQLHGMGQDLVDSTGRVYASKCDQCGYEQRHWKPDTEAWICGNHKCHFPWPYEDVEILKGEVCRASRGGKPIPAPRAGEFERRLAALAHLGHHLNAMLRDDYWRWATQVLVGHALTSLGYLEIAVHANGYGWPIRRGEWTEAGARQRASRARVELRRRLETRKSEITPRAQECFAEAFEERTRSRRRMRDPRFAF